MGMIEQYWEENLCVKYKYINGIEVSALWWNNARMKLSLLKDK